MRRGREADDERNAVRNGILYKKGPIYSSRNLEGKPAAVQG
jgi:hypothetical protein